MGKNYKKSSVYNSGSQIGRYRPQGVSWTIQGVDKYSRGRMGVNE